MNGYELAAALCAVAALLLAMWVIGTGSAWAASLAVALIVLAVFVSIIESARRG